MSPASSTTAHYRAHCGRLYRVRTLPATRQQPARTLQGRRRIHAPDFSPEYSTHPNEVARLVAIGFFVPTAAVPCP